MIKLFSKIRQNLLIEGKTIKYFKYAVGEIILVVIGILIALQLNTSKENRQQSDLGYKYLTEMRTEVESDLIGLDIRIRMLDKNIENHESALQTKNISTLPLDSVAMILRPENLDFKISELTFNRMKNLGLTALTNNEALNSQISTYYNVWVVSLKLSMDYVFEELRTYENYALYQQDVIDFSFFKFNDKTFEFPALYTQSNEEFKNEMRSKSIQFITSNRGRMLVLNDLHNKRYSSRVLKRFKKRTQNLLEAIFEELKKNNPQIEPLQDLVTDVDFKEIMVAPAVLKKYLGTYRSDENMDVTVLEEGTQLFIRFDKGNSIPIIPTARDKFFLLDEFDVIQFNRKKSDIISFTVNLNGKKIDYIKVD